MKRIFSEHMTELYRLAFLLTGDREKSIQAFTGALNSDDTPPAFQRFMLAWAKRLVIVTALATIRRQVRESILDTQLTFRGEWPTMHLKPVDLHRLTSRELEAALLGMDVLPRCSVVLGLLESLPLEEVSNLLAADKKTVKAALAQGAAELTWRLVGSTQPQADVRSGVWLKALAACQQGRG